MPLWRMRCKDVKETSNVPLVYYAKVISPQKRSGGPGVGARRGVPGPCTKAT